MPKFYIPIVRIVESTAEVEANTPKEAKAKLQEKLKDENFKPAEDTQYFNSWDIDDTKCWE